MLFVPPWKLKYQTFTGVVEYLELKHNARIPIKIRLVMLSLTIQSSAKRLRLAA